MLWCTIDIYFLGASTFVMFRNVFVVKLLFYFSGKYLLQKYFSNFQEHICCESTFLFFKNVFVVKVLFYFSGTYLLGKYFSIFQEHSFMKVLFYFQEHICCESIFLFLPLSIMSDPHQNSLRKLRRNIKWTRSRVWHWLKTPTTRTHKTYLNVSLSQHWIDNSQNIIKFKF